MENKKYSKRAVLISIIAVLMCCTLLVGGTFAWFTDTATTGINTIESGNLDIELYYATQADVIDGTIADDAWKPVSADESVFNPSALWEPGYTEIVYFKAANLGNLSLKYHMGVDIYNEKSSTNKYGAEFFLSDYIVGYAKQDLVGTFAPFTTRADAIAPAGAPEVYFDTLANAVAGAFDGWETGDYSSTSMNMSQWLEPEETFYTTLVLWMPEEVGNEANYLEAEDVEAPQIQLGVYVTATQYSWADHEVDSFDHTYDEDATYDDISFGLGYYGTDTTMPAVRVEKGETTTVADEALEKPVYNNGGEVVVKGGSITNNFTGVYNNGGNTELSNVTVNAGTPADYAIIGANGSYTALNDTTVNSKGGAIAAVNGATVVIDGGSYEVNSTNTSARYTIYAVGEGTKVVVNDGTFSFQNNKAMKRAYVYAADGVTVEINGGEFGPASTRSGYPGIMGTGKVIVKGGTFGFDPSNWVAEGYEAVKSGSTWTVSAK